MGRRAGRQAAGAAAPVSKAAKWMVGGQMQGRMQRRCIAPRFVAPSQWQGAQASPRRMVYQYGAIPLQGLCLQLRQGGRQ